MTAGLARMENSSRLHQRNRRQVINPLSALTPKPSSSMISCVVSWEPGPFSLLKQLVASVSVRA